MTSRVTVGGAVFDWPRWWVPRSAELELESGAFLWDPQGRFAAGINPDARQLSGVTERVAILLGEPGAGKTRSVSDYAASRDDLTVIALPDEVSVKDLRARVGEALDGTTGDVTLIFDGLDEAMIRTGNSDVWIPAALRGRSRDALDRLRVRLTCRPAVWPESLSPKLAAVWPEEQPPAELTLTPLRRVDVLTAAAQLGLDGQAFLDVLSEREALPFAARPVTLTSLLLDFADDQLPSSKSSVYLSMCQRLARELNASVRDATLGGVIPGRDALQVAGRLAALTEFTGRPVIWVGADDRDRHASELDAQEANIAPDINSSAIRSALNTGLFETAGNDRFRFAHRTYGEFLAAYYATEAGLSTQDVLGLVLDKSGQAVQAQLGEVAAWLATLQSAVFDYLVDHDPVVLLDSDVATRDDADRERLATAVLTGQESEPVPPLDWAKLRRQACDALVPRLAEILIGAGHSDRARRAALEIAAELPNMQSTLIALTCDEDVDGLFRAATARRLGPDLPGDDRARVLTLMTQPGLDAELRGSLLLRLWPQSLTLNEMLGVASQPTHHQEGRAMLTSYDHFLTTELPPTVQSSDLPTVLEWAANLAGMSAAHGEAADVLLARTLYELEAGAATAAAMLLLVRQGHYGRHWAAVNAALDTLAGDTARRRSLLAAVIADTDDERTLLVTAARAASPDDFGWAVEHAADTTRTQPERRRWLKLAKRVFVPFDRSHQLDELWKFADDEEVATAFWEVFKGVPASGPVADQMRARNAEERQWTEGSRKWRQSQKPDFEAVAAALVSESSEAWLDLMRALDPQFTVGVDLGVAKLKGWQHLTDAERAQATALARRWLASSVPALDDPPGTWPMDSIYALRAMWLHDHDTALLDSLTAEQWAAWGRVLLGTASVGSDASTSARRDLLIGRAHERAPEALHEALRSELDLQALSAQTELQAKPTEPDRTLDPLRPIMPLYAHTTLTSIWDNRLSDVLLAWQRERGDDIGVVETIPFLAARGHADAEALAISALGDTASARRRVAGAVALLRCPNGSAYWSTIWQQWNDGEAFALAVVQQLHRSASGWELPNELSGLESVELEKLYLWLHQRRQTELKRPGLGVADVADAIINRLKSAGTRDSVESLRSIASALPDDEDLLYHVAEAERRYRANSWMPPRVEDVATLLDDPQRRLATTDAALAEVVVESLRHAQRQISGETPAVADLWDHPQEPDQREPKVERALSDWLTRHFRSDLPSVLVNREVEITPGFRGVRKMREVDIYLSAVSSADASRQTTLKVIVEDKGCWNPNVLTDMKYQLVDTYLAQTKSGAGVYVVFSFDCLASGSRRKCPSCIRRSVEQLREELERQAAELTTVDRAVTAVVLDARLVPT